MPSSKLVVCSVPPPFRPKLAFDPLIYFLCVHGTEWEMNNLYKSADPVLKKKLHDELEKLYRCKGATCN